MASNVTHIYRVDMGYDQKIVCTHWVYARNASVAKNYCKEKFKKYHYSTIKPVMVGENVSFPPQEVSSLSEEEVCYIDKTQAKVGDKYVYHRNEVSGL